MKVQIFRFDVGKCTCCFEDAAQGELRLFVTELTVGKALLLQAPELSSEAYVDVELQFESGAKTQLLAQVVKLADEGVYVLRWVHSDLLGESQLEAFLRKRLESDGGESTVGADFLSVEDEPDLLPIKDAFDDRDDAEKPLGAASAAEGVAVKPPLIDPSVRKAATTKTDRRTENKAGTQSNSSTSQADAEAGDVAKSLRRKAKMVLASDLAARHDKVRVLNETTVKNFIQEAVGEAVEKMETTLGEKDRRRLLEEAEDGFKDRLEAFQADKAGLEKQAEVLNNQLDRAKMLLGEERKRVVRADQFTVSDAGIIEIEARLGRMFDRAVVGGGLNEQLEGEMRQVLSTLLDEERDKIQEKAKEAQSDHLELLERKIGRLAKTLQSAEHERDSAQRRARALEEAGVAGLRNVVTTGLDTGDPDRKKKLGLLKEIFQQNQEMRKALAVRRPPETQREKQREVVLA